MKLSRQPSFRRILLLRILIISVPILLIGVAVAYRKARTTLLYTARQNLTESAVRKAENIETSVRALQSNLVAASETLALRSGTPEEARAFLEQLAMQLPTNAYCLQLIDWQTKQPISESCEEGAPTATLMSELNQLWPQDRSLLIDSRFFIQSLSVHSVPQSEDQPALRSQLNLVLSTPVYNVDDQLQYLLAVRAKFTQLESGEPGSLLGYTVVIDESGTVLAHPFADWVGQNVYDREDGDRYRSIIKSALRGDQDVRHLFNFSGDGSEWLAGYSSSHVSISPTQDQTWVVFAVTRIDNALHGLEEIKRILIVLTGGLLIAHLIAMLYMSRDLARPIERLGEYARHIHERHLKDAPRNFRVRELNQLADVLDTMVQHLEERARELESAWQEAETANQLKSEFLANTSHELRTPLNAIIGCIRLVKDECCDDREEELEFLDRADEAAIHLLKIINDLLDIAKIEAGTLSLCLENVNVERVLQEVIALQTVEAHQKGLWLTANELHSVVVQADQAKLKQVFLNIIYNAIKFTDQGGITIDTRLEPDLDTSLFVVNYSKSRPKAELAAYPDQQNGSTPPSWIVISIQDTGIGIDPAQQHKLFHPFVMVDGSTTRKFEGTGLGLAISRNLIELMGGYIRLMSVGLGHGTTVEIALPVVSLSQPATSTPSLSSGGVIVGKVEPVREAGLPTSNQFEATLTQRTGVR
ncbi:MAG: ATP-binding protein [Elainellaceae cyanobacterium]